VVERVSQHLGLSERLLAAGIQPSAQRLAIGEYVLFTEDHPSADEVLMKMAEKGRGVSMISRATVYNTLNLFVEKERSTVARS
jgi:Fe2+ or Zn2+ uptake regulation protein